MRTLFVWLRSFFLRGRLESEMNDELRFHLERQIEDNVKAGMTRKEAHYAALRSFGGVEQIKEKCRGTRGIRFLEELWQDIRYGARMLRRNPGFTSVAVVTLALGIGANTAIFSVVHGVLLRPLPYRDPERLAAVLTNINSFDTGSSYLNFKDWREQSGLFEDMACYREESLALRGFDEPERIKVGLVPANLFPLLGVPPVLGRQFSFEEVDRGERVVVLSYGLWQLRFQASPDVIGRTVELENGNAQVIGVMPAQFEFPTKETQLWAPQTVDAWWPDLRKTRFNKGVLSVIGRLKPEATFQQAQTEMNTIAGRLEAQHRDENTGVGITIVPLHLQATRRIRLSLWVLFGAVLCVLLIACANVASLVLARGSAREGEIALRVALGASRARIIRQFLTESVVISLVSGAAGTLFAAWGIRAVLAFGPGEIPRLEQIGVDNNVLAFVLVISLLSGIFFGLVPALKASGSAFDGSLRVRSGSSSRLASRRMLSLLVVAEFAVTLVLACGAGLLIRSFLTLRDVDPGFRPERVLTARILLPVSKTPAQRVAFFEEVIRRVEALPGVEAAGVVGKFFVKLGGTARITVEGRGVIPARQLTPIDRSEVSGGYFQTIGVPLLRGRYFSEKDSPSSAPEVIINETMARDFWPGGDPIGRRFKMGDESSKNTWHTVVGVVGDMRRHSLEKPAMPQYFEPHTRTAWNERDLVVRTASDPLQLAAAVRGAVRSVDQSVLRFEITTMENQMREQTSQRRFHTWLLGLFAAAAGLLAALGIYGVMRYSVVQRTREIGLRMAVGAQVSDVLGMIVREGMALTVTGVAVGLAGALGITKILSNLLYGVTPSDPLTFAIATLSVTGLAAAACYIPARRAAQVDPMVALRHE